MLEILLEILAIVGPTLIIWAIQDHRTKRRGK